MHDSGRPTLLRCALVALVLPCRSAAAGDEVTLCEPGGGGLRLSSAGPAWDGWPELCAELGRYLGARAGLSAAEWSAEAERRLMATGYFGEISCHLEAETLACHTSARGMVRRVDVTGDVPFPLLGSDLERRLMLRPGMLTSPEVIDRQLDRLKRHLDREGIFGVEITTELEDAPAEGPNHGLDIVVRLSGGTKYSVGRVEVRGDPVVSADAVGRRVRHSWIPFLVEERFSPARLRTDVDELGDWLRRNGWPEARARFSYSLDAERGVADIAVTIDSGPKVTLTFSGNRILDDDDLSEVATFAESGSVDAVEIEATAARIAELYQREGYHTVTVTADSKEQSPGGLTVEFVIAEGERATVGTVSFQGNRHLDDAALRALRLRTRTEGLLRSGRWVDAWAEEDCTTLRELLRSSGFGAATVSAEKALVAPGDLSVTFRIEEGERHRVAAVVVDGAPEGFPGAPEERLALVTGAPFEERLLGRDEQTLLVRLAEEGYVAASVDHAVVAAADGGRVIQWTVQPGARAVLGGLLARGNVRTGAGFLARDLDLDPGEPVRLETLSNGRRRLRGLGIFHGVDLEPLPTRDPANTWLLVAVQERQVQSLDAALSFSTDDLFAVGLDYSDRNWLGQAIALDLKFRVSNASELGSSAARIGNADRASLGLRAPHPLGAPFDATASARFSQEDKRLFAEQQALAGVGLNRQMLTRQSCGACPDVVLGLGYEVSVTRSREKLSDADTLAGVPFERSFKLVPSLMLDRTDSFISPQRGYRGSAQLELAHPLLGGGLTANTYWRLTALAAGFVPLFTPFSFETDGGTRIGGPVLAMAGVRYGAAQPFGADERLPDAEAFYYGGDLSVRGMESRASTVAVVEGRYLMTGTAELRWRLFPDTWFGAVELGGFVDAGTVAHGLPDLFGEIAVSGGPSLRLVTLVGPLAVSYAWPMVRPQRIVARDPRVMPVGGRLHITFGATY